jgi:lipopolysaccharide export system permease protein
MNISRFKNIKEKIPDSIKSSIISNVSGKIAQLRSQSQLMLFDNKEIRKEIRLHSMEQHRKFALSFACILFFMIGAPLGTITRKGGLGMPLVISVFFFIVFHILNTSGEKMVKEGVMFPYSGMWLSSMILIPIGLFLMYKARKDAQPFSNDFPFKIWNTIKRFFPGKKMNSTAD